MQGRALSLGEFAKRVAVVALIGILTYAVWRLADLVLLLFASTLFAIGLRAGATFMARRLHIRLPFALALVMVGLLAALGAALWFFGTVAAGQMGELARQIPVGAQLLLGKIQSTPFGRFALEQAKSAGVAGATGWVASLASTMAQGLVLGLGYVVLTFFASVYLAAQPDLYRQMCLRVLPPIWQPRVRTLFARTVDVLRHWMAGQFVVMVVIGVLSGLGLWALGIEAAFALGLVGGLLTFIPYVGAILAAVPATLVALTQGPTQAGVVLLMYMAVHFIEGNFITPLVQAEATALPPVLALLSTVGFSMLFGPSAVLLAAPLTLFLIVMIEVLWVEQGLEQAA
jgi:predicted PurR-regulated permease PerM